MTTREDIVACAESYLDVPFRMNGRSRRGIDCVGLGFAVARDLKVEGWQELWNDPECHQYATVRPPTFMRAKFQEFCDNGILRLVDRIDINRGDLVLHWGGFKRQHHVSVYLGKGWVVEGSNQQEPRWPNGHVRKRWISNTKVFVAGYQFAGVM
jgi:cell wall-associated NlpC family hydrolase